MTTTETLHPRHPILGCVEQVVSALDAVSELDPMYMLTSDKRAALLGVEQAARKLAALRMDLAAVGDDVADEDGARNVAAWLAHQTGTHRGQARHVEAMGRLFREKWKATGSALAAGTISTDQARIIVHALEGLDEGAGRPVPDQAKLDVEKLMLTEAAHCDLSRLRRLGDQALEILDPVTYGRQEGKKVDAEEERATKAARASFKDRGDGSVLFTATLPKAAAARLKKYLHSYTSPRVKNPLAENSPEGEVTRLPWNRRLGHAFCAFLESLDPESMPISAGSPTTVVITIPLSDLASELGVGTLADGTTMSAREVRRLACNAGIIPAVLGGPSQDLDLGRRRRLFNGRQRIVLAKGHPTCRAEGCDIPAEWCEAHHAGDPWAKGGKTDLAEGKLLCSWHHHRAHDPGYSTETLPNGDVRFHQRT